MTENVHVVTEVPETKSRFNKRQIIKATAITATVVAAVVVLKRKLNGSVDGELNVNVETDNQS